MAHHDLASRIHLRNAAESGQTRTDAKTRRRHRWRGGFATHPIRQHDRKALAAESMR